MSVKPKPDDRRDNVKKIQRNINRTIQNMEAAEEMIAKTDDPKTKEALAEKNERRRAGLDGMRSEIRDEAEHQKKTEPGK
jgi:small acid-soluble spore protein (thioredoxin-like protein)